MAAELLAGLTPAGMALGAISPLARGIAGTVQMVKADKLRKKYPFPTYGIPGAETESLENARNLAYDPRLPGQRFIEEGIDRSLATGIRGIRETGMSGGERLAGITAGIGSQMDAYTNLAAQGAANAQTNYGNLQGQLNEMAGYQDKQWQLNKQQPYLDAMAAANRLSDSGQQNIINSVTDLTSVGAAGLKGLTGGQTSGTGGGTGGYTIPNARVAPAGGTVGVPSYNQFASDNMIPGDLPNIQGKKVGSVSTDPAKRLEEIAMMQYKMRGM